MMQQTQQVQGGELMANKDLNKFSNTGGF